MEQAESDEQAEARPHPWGASSLPQTDSTKKRGGSGEEEEEFEREAEGKKGGESFGIGQAQHVAVIKLHKRSNKGYCF